RPRDDTMRMVSLHGVVLTAVMLSGVGTALAEPTTTQTLVAMSLLTGEDQKPPAPPPPKPKAPPPGGTGQPPARPASPAAPPKPGMPAPATGTPVPSPVAPAAPQAGGTPPTAAPAPAMMPGSAPGAPPPPVENAEAYSYDPKSRRDPFQSLTKVIKSASLQSQMPPLQRVQISDMKLLGIMWGGYGYHGLIQTPAGKGYTVKEGMLLGANNGVIRTITD